MNREIPGFYYDTEKKKYFRIQASHAAAPGAQYSKDAVKRKRKEQEVGYFLDLYRDAPDILQKQQRRVRLSRRVATETIKKAPILSHPLIGADKEIGSLLSQNVKREHYALAYASQMRWKQLHRFEPWPDDYSIKHVLRNNRSGILIASGYRGGESSVSVCFPDCDQEKWTYDRTMERVLFKAPYRVSSLSLSHTGYLLATMDSGPSGDSFLAPRMLPDPDEGGDYRWPHSFAHPIRIRTTPSLWCSSPCPVGPKPLFAIGTSHGLHTLEGIGSYWSLSKKPYPNDVVTDQPILRRPQDSSHAVVFTVEWLSSNVIAAGLKDSSIYLHDLRSGGTATRLQHSDGVSKIRRVDEYRLVVAGMNSLRMYDIRFPPNGLQRSPNPMHHRHISTRPYLTFPDYSPSFFPDFDLCPELGLLASGKHHLSHSPKGGLP
ncbi:hypothetical protein PHISCL_04914 [Aspergillus sclerotialis]|uniref:Uncharacterized protein n=1 Tax=Aspergillus sclerotialis TaxID=2070753 RepID=A0A3A2ZHR8_9EURO|nr:hypothetical protein PHISCL_04914 [Aspergillus sclerotialis]